MVTPGIAQSPAPFHLASTLASTDIAQQAKSVSVLIQSPGNSGSGVLIQRQGQTYTVLTAAHVVSSPKAPYTLILADEKIYTATDVKTLAGIDLAVVTFQSDRTYPVAVLGSSQNLGEASPVYVAGFPAGTAAITRSVYTFTEGTVTARSNKSFADGYAMVYSNNTLPGMSGGGVFNRAGQLVGIHGRGDVDPKAEPSKINPNIVVKTGFNLGIPIETFANRAAEAGLKVALLPTSTPAAVANPADDLVVAATVKAQQGDYNGAIADMNRAIAQTPNVAKLYFARATYATAMGRSDLAFQDYDKVIQLNPKSEAAYWIRGNSRYAQKDMLGAIQDFSKVIELNPNHKEAYQKRGFAYSLQANGGQSIADYTNVLRLDPKNTHAYEMRAMWRRTQGDTEGAIADYNQLIQLAPKLLDPYFRRAELLQTSGNQAGAIADYKTLLKLDPQQQSLPGQLARNALNRIELKRDPVGFQSGQIQANPKDVKALQARAILFLEKEEYAKAIADYSAILQADPKNKAALRDRADAYVQTKQFREAIQDYDRLLSVSATSPAAKEQADAYAARGEVFEQSGQTSQAIADFRKAAALFRRSGDRDSRADHFEDKAKRLESWLQDIVEYTQRIKADPTNIDNYISRGILYRDLNQYKLQKADFQKVIELHQQSGNQAGVEQYRGYIQSIECEEQATCKK
jgi:tetratricopeptide (TPR) repeat protein